MLQDLLNGHFTLEAISSVSVQITIVAILTQFIKNILETKGIPDCWFPIVGIGVGIVTQVIVFIGIYGLTSDNVILSLFHGTVYGAATCGTYDVGAAISAITSILTGKRNQGNKTRDEGK